MKKHTEINNVPYLETSPISLTENKRKQQRHRKNENETPKSEWANAFACRVSNRDRSREGTLKRQKSSAVHLVLASSFSHSTSLMFYWRQKRHTFSIGHLPTAASVSLSHSHSIPSSSKHAISLTFSSTYVDSPQRLGSIRAHTFSN